MEIYNQSQITTYTGQDYAASPVKVGDTSSVVVKERTGNNEAKVLLKGQEMTVTFDGPMPAEDKALVQVTKQSTNGQFTVKTLGNPKAPSTSPSVDDVLKKSGFDPNTNLDLKEAANRITSRGGNVTKDSLANIQDFLKNDTGTVGEKLETITIMQQKNLAFTKTQLHAVNTALHGAPLADSLIDLAGGSLDIPDLVKSPSTNESKAVEKILSTLDPVKDTQTIADIKKALQIQQAGKDRILQALPDSDLKKQLQQETDLRKIIAILKEQQLAVNVENAMKDALKLQRIGENRLEAAFQNEQAEDPAQAAIKELISSIQKDPSFANVLDKLKQLLDSQTTIDMGGLKQAFEKATALFGQGRELAARKEVSTAIQQLQESNPQLKKTEDDQLSKAEQYDINEAIQSLKLDSKNILVTQITKKLSQLAIDFKKTRQEISHNLDAAVRLMESNKQAGVVSAKQMLESTINKLDQSILKSNFLLYTDMETEIKLLTSSSRLSEAKNLLNKGNISEANKIVKEIKSVIDQMTFKPSDSRVKHFISEQDLLSPKAMLEKTVRPLPDITSARSVFETVKKLGLTHEADAANSLIHKEEASSNVKSLLLQMLQDGQAKPSVEQALSSITGQQLLNKQDSSGVQNLFMQLPILLNKQVENVKVYVNSQKKSEKIDWENCNLTFLLETKKLGEIGISVSVANRNLSITFQNNREELQDRVAPLTEDTKERLQEIGYNVGNFQFKSFSEESSNGEQKSTPIKAVFTEKGYDFTI